MSTYYFLACDKHKEYCDGASRTAGGFCHLCDSETTLPPFIIKHQGCDINIISEHAFDLDEKYEGYTEWDKGNYIELYNKD
jgi:hypothetical protein